MLADFLQPIKEFILLTPKSQSYNECIDIHHNVIVIDKEKEMETSYREILN
jgi:hypothetical protein